MKKTKAEFKRAGTSNGKKIVLKIITIALSILALFITFSYLQRANNAALDTVDIVRVKKDLPGGTAIGTGDVEKYAIIRKEYDKDHMIPYDGVEEVGDILHEKFTSYYLRGGSPLYYDQLTEKRLPRDIILETLEEGYELTTIPYNYMEAGGNKLLPGDLIRMRVSYEVDAMPQDAYDYEYEYDYYDGRYYQWTKRIIRTDTVFDSIAVVDMLNAKGDSIYNIYQEIMRLSEKERQEILKSKDFLTSVKPKSLELALLPEEVELYNSYKISAGNGSFLITILGRAGNDIDFDAFTTIETEVRSWLDGGSTKR